MGGKLFIDFSYMKVIRALAEGPATRPQIEERVDGDFSSSAPSRLKERGYVSTRTLVHDPNKYVWTLSEKGEAVIREMSERWQDAEATMEEEDV